jgi:hypothetical protein
MAIGAAGNMYFAGLTAPCWQASVSWRAPRASTTGPPSSFSEAPGREKIAELSQMLGRSAAKTRQAPAPAAAALITPGASPRSIGDGALKTSGRCSCKESPKARERGEDYATQTAKSAAAAVARRQRSHA